LAREPALLPKKSSYSSVVGNPLETQEILVGRKQATGQKFQKDFDCRDKCQDMWGPEKEKSTLNQGENDTIMIMKHSPER